LWTEYINIDISEISIIGSLSSRDFRTHCCPFKCHSRRVLCKNLFGTRRWPFGNFLLQLSPKQNNFEKEPFWLPLKINSRGTFRVWPQSLQIFWRSSELRKISRILRGKNLSPCKTRTGLRRNPEFAGPQKSGKILQVFFSLYFWRIKRFFR